MRNDQLERLARVLLVEGTVESAFGRIHLSLTSTTQGPVLAMSVTTLKPHRHVAIELKAGQAEALARELAEAAAMLGRIDRSTSSAEG